MSEKIYYSLSSEIIWCLKMNNFEGLNNEEKKIALEYCTIYKTYLNASHIVDMYERRLGNYTKVNKFYLNERARLNYELSRKNDCILKLQKLEKSPVLVRILRQLEKTYGEIKMMFIGHELDQIIDINPQTEAVMLAYYARKKKEKIDSDDEVYI